VENAAVAVKDEPPSSWSLLVRGQTSVRTQIVPVALYGAGAGFELAHDGFSSWQLAVGATVESTLMATAGTNAVASNTEMAELAGQLSLGHFFASPLRLRTGPVEVRPYASLDVGRLVVQGRGSGLLRETENPTLWMAAALSIQTDVRLARRWSAGASVGAEVHPFLYQFQYTDRDVYQVGGVGLIASVLLTYRFD
jgi:hypothetical protein